ncbi:hypothetical protein A6M21_06510 [Desulfotomaculum copahuensis]|uniref:Uncharacterized protein n=2 Tax=Desulfotomaculum copahuensis TaxID=1838280 RepID=A0A1B7LGH2_9FIRM|nr:hypothetical protein A6M21_06510 [Desulfotomaculum copahuensis]
MCILLVLGQPAVSQAGFLTTLLQRISSARKQYQSASQQKEQTTATIKALQSKSAVIRQQLALIDHDLGNQAREISSGEAKLAGLKQAILKEQADIQATSRQRRQKQQLLDQILVRTYQNGPASYLNVLLGAQNFFDFLTRFQYVKQILAFDNNVVKNLARIQATLTAENQSLVNEQSMAQNELAGLKQLQAGQLAEQKQKRLLLASLQQQENHEKSELDAETRAMQYMAAQIMALQQQYGGGASGAPAPSGGWVWPVPASHVISSGYGWRSIMGFREFHDGIDIAAPDGTPIVAANSGVVLFAGPAEGFGHWIVIEHSAHLFSVYGHMYANEILVHPGEHVSAGQQIAAVGADGFATGPHLHFSVITGFDSSGHMISVNPLNYV